MIAQMVGAGQLIQLLFGLDYAYAVVIVGILASLGLPFYASYALQGNLKQAIPVMMAIAAKERIHFNRTGYYLATGDEQMRLILDTEWTEVDSRQPVQWWGVHDRVTVYERMADETSAGPSA